MAMETSSNTITARSRRGIADRGIGIAPGSLSIAMCACFVEALLH